MKHSRNLTYVLVLILLIISCTAQNNATDMTSSPAKKVLAIQNNSPIITFRIMIQAGSAYDPKGKEGLAALTANLLNEGGNQTFTYKEILKKLYPMAASTNVVIDKETVTFVGKVHRDFLKNFYTIFSENILKPRFDQNELERLRSDAINHLEKTLRGSNNEELGKQALEIEIYSNTPYGHAVTGTVQSLKSIKLDDVKDFYKHFYTQPKLTIAIAGNVTNEFTKKMEMDFAVLPKISTTDLKPTKLNTPEGLEITLIEKETQSSAISLGFPIDITRKDPDFYALLVANSFLGEHRTFNGLLMQNMRGKRGLNYGDYSYIEHFVQEGYSTFANPNVPRNQQYFSIWIRPVPNEFRLFAMRQAIWELDRFISKGMTEQEFDATKRFLLNYSKLWVQELGRRLGYRLDSQFYGINDYTSEIQNHLMKLKLADVNSAIKKHLNSNNLKAVMVTQDAESLKSQLLTNAISPMRYESSTPQDILNEDKEIERYKLPVNKEKLKIMPVSELFEK